MNFLSPITRTAPTLNTLLRIWSAGPNRTLTFGIPHFLSFTLQLSSGVFESLPLHGFTELDQVESVIIRSILSISTADRRQLAIVDPLASQAIGDVMLALQSFIVWPPSLPNLQAVVSVQPFLISMLRLDAVSRIGAFIVRMALHLGLHWCPGRFEQFSPAEVDIRRRLFWSIYSLERCLSQSPGLPLDLREMMTSRCATSTTRPTRHQWSV
jgi:Fungal specific transcription factor domain